MSDMHADLRTEHDVEGQRYELRTDDTVHGVAHYRRRDDAIDVYSTQIDPARRGQGLGAVLVRDVLDDLAERGEDVIASCWYVDEFIDANPSYAHLRKGSPRRPSDLPSEPGAVRKLTDGPAADQANPEDRPPADVARSAHREGLVETDPDNPRRR